MQLSANILLIDDDDLTLEMLERKLGRENHSILKAGSGEQALEELEKHEYDVDLMICDMSMPGMDGFEFLTHVKNEKQTAHIPVLILSAHDNMDAIVMCIRNGADDYLVKPCNNILLRARVNSCLTKKRLFDQERKYQNKLRELNEDLSKRVAKQVKDIAAANLSSLFAMSKLAESKDPETGAHLDRVREYCRLLALQLSKRSKYFDLIDEEYIETIFATSPLHDIGKVAIPDKILLKPGKLDIDEWKIMRQHTVAGANALRDVAQHFPDNNYLNMAIEIAECHHEYWNGTGYPRGLKGTDIPLCARIVAVADVYDALTSARCYKKAYSHNDSKEIILKANGSQFDPDVVDAFLALEKEFVSIRTSIVDEEKETLAMKLGNRA